MKTKMIMLIAACVCAFAVFAATPLATQEWVKKQLEQYALSPRTESDTDSLTCEIKTNATTSTGAPAGSVDYVYHTPEGAFGDSNIVSVTFQVTPVTTFALCVVESNIDGVSVGDKWVLRRNPFTLQNVSNNVFSTWACSENVVTNCETNAFKEVTSNVTTRIHFTATDNQGRTYTSAKSGMHYYLIDDADIARRLKLVEIRVTDAERDSLYVSWKDSIKLRWQEFLFGSAYAVVVNLHHWGDADVERMSQDVWSIPGNAPIQIIIKDKVGGYETLNIDTLDYGSAVNKIAVYRDIENPMSEAVFKNPITWLALPKIYTTQEGNEIKLSQRLIEKDKSWQEFIDNAYKKYLLLIAYLRLTANVAHECKLDDECNCIFMNAEPPNTCDRENPQHKIKEQSKTIECEWCERCHIKKDPTFRFKIEHKAKSQNASSGCECQCGYYSAEHDEDSDQFSDDFHCGENNTRDCECWCFCGKKHLNPQESDCPGVCYCGRKMNETDIKKLAPLTAHTPFDRSKGDTPSHCGCKCGLMVGAKIDLERFSGSYDDFQNTGSVVDDGIDGDIFHEWISAEENFNKFHYIRDVDLSNPTIFNSEKLSGCWCFCKRRHEKKDSLSITGEDGSITQYKSCPGFCAICNGVNNKGYVPISEAFDNGDSKDGKPRLELHEKADNVCACKCGRIGDHTGGYPVGDTDFHEFGGDCVCICSIQVHNMTSNECPKVCGKCKLASEPRTLFNGEKANVVKTLTKITDHEPDVYTCGCACGIYTPETESVEFTSAPDYHKQRWDEECGCKCGKLNEYETNKLRWHKGEGVPACRCKCGKSHMRSNHNTKGVNECDVCSLCYCTWNLVDGTDEKYHKLNATLTNAACKCWCGLYDNSFSADTKRLHRFLYNASTSYTNCTCVCDKKHEYRNPSTYDINLKQKCPGICAVCCDRNNKEERVKDSDHTPVEHSHARCGCWCGKTDINADETAKKYHLKKPGTCRCYGAKDSNGGRFHFREPKDGCTNICRYKKDGEELWHLAAKKDHEVEIFGATTGDHTPDPNNCGCLCGEIHDTDDNRFHKKKINDCGCMCGKFSMAQDNVPEDFHTASATCLCYCGKSGRHNYNANECVCKCETMHRRDFMTACPLICGNCNMAFRGIIHEECRVADGKPVSNEDHTLKRNDCGCMCGKLSLALRTAHHGGDPYTPCWCYCRELHRGYESSSLCGFCDTCNYSEQGKIHRTARSSLHALKEGTCQCDCGQWTQGEVVGHTRKNDDCKCVCGTKKYDHQWVLSRKNTLGTHECPICHKKITRWTKTDRCFVCGKTSNPINWEEGHALDCRNKQPEQAHCSCGCTLAHCASCQGGYGICNCGSKCGHVDSNGKDGSVDGSMSPSRPPDDV